MQIELKENTLIADVEGDLDHHNVEEVRYELDLKICSMPLKNIIFNLSKLEFMDSSGIGLILGRYKKMIAMGGKVYISGPKPSVLKVIRISGLNKLIPIYKTTEDALKFMCEVSK